MRAKDIWPEAFVSRADGLCNFWRLNGWTYGDDHGTPPCCNGHTSCDGLISRALWDLGMTDQPEGYRVVVSQLGEWLERHGFVKSTSYSDAKRGSICIVHNKDGGLHTFIISEVKGSNMVRYDTGSDWCIKNKQPFETGFSEYPDLIALYNFPTLNKIPLWTGVVVNCEALHVRKWAGKDYKDENYYPTLDSQPFIRKNAVVSVLDEVCAKDGNTWYYIKTKEGKHGFVRASYIKEA